VYVRKTGEVGEKGNGSEDQKRPITVDLKREKQDEGRWSRKRKTGGKIRKEWLKGSLRSRCRNRGNRRSFSEADRAPTIWVIPQKKTPKYETQTTLYQEGA